MLTTAFTRVAAVTVAFAALATIASSAGAQSTTPAAAATPAVPTTTGTIPITPTTSTQPATDPATSDQAASKAPETKTVEPPASAVANAATPSAPAGATPAATTPATTAPAASTPAAAPPVAPAAAPSTPAAPSAAQIAPAAGAAPVATAAPAATVPVTPDAPPATTPLAPSAQTAPAAGSAPAAVAAGVPAVPAATTPAATIPPPAAVPPPSPPVDPVVAAVRTWLETSGNASKSNKEDVAATVAFYAARTGGPLWVEGTDFNAKAKSAMDEVRKADDWGLSAAAFDLPSLAAGASTDALAAAEGKLTLELLKYVRFARGGRINLASLSRILDQKPPLKDPNAVIPELAAASSPDAYLRDQHPKHPQFQLLHKALLKARGPSEPAIEIDPALKINLPATKETLKIGIDHPNVALLRQRLKVPAEGGAPETEFDDKLELALKAYQVEKGIKASGQLSGATRVSLNKEGEARRAPDPGRATQLIVLNMERWRWLPETLGSVYVWNNIPEYTTRVIKGDEVLFKERIIVGLPQWATPLFSESMKTIVFNPSWGMPDGIKTRELQPRLRAAGGGFLFFGGGGGGSIIRAYGLDVYRGNQRIDPDSVDWSNADVRNYSFVQPPGGKNPLGTVKFLFPNRHDVYMHDTIERSLFEQPSRALSHGCIRVRNPRQFAELMIAEGNGVSAAQAANIASGGGDIKLKNPVPVHITYFTAVADADGDVSTFGDIYGHDSRLSSALTGRALRYDPTANVSDEVATSDDYYPPAETKQSKKKKVRPPDTLSDVISGFWMN